MQIPFKDFDPARFSFRDHPVLILEDFWSASERARFRSAMAGASQWQTLQEMPATAKAFKNCGNWLKTELVDPEKSLFIERTLLPCMASHVDSFEGVRQRVMSFNYYSYAVGDSLSMHDDMNSADPEDPRRESLKRRIAIASYFHERWEPDWGGEFIAYRRRTNAGGHGAMEVTHCIPPYPGALVAFTVPRHHRVCRVDPLAGAHRRLSITGWLMTEH